MDKLQRAIAVERLLFVGLVIVLAVGGFCYGQFRGEMPDWQLAGLIATGFVAAYVLYRLVLKRALSRLRL